MLGPDISDFSFLRLKQKFDWFSDICFSQAENTANSHKDGDDDTGHQCTNTFKLLI